MQRLVVEHVIRNDASASQNQSKWLRSFSGRVPKPPDEADYGTWYLHVDLMFQDCSSIDIQRRKILENILPPASDVVKQLGSSAHPRDYMKLLDSAFGLVEDGEEIFAKFLNTNQNPGEKASEYLQRLHALLSTAVKRNGVKKSDVDRHLLKQFRRGCWDHTLILQLELKTDKPPDFAELLWQLRREEDRRATKLDRMHRHFGTSKSKSAAHVHSMSPYSDPHTDVLQAYLSETENLRKQVSELQLQLNTKKKNKAKCENKVAKKVETPPTTRVEHQVHQVTPQATPHVTPQTTHRSQPKAWFCFRCGGDGHIARACENPINKEAVEQKYRELKVRQEKGHKTVTYVYCDYI